MRAFLWLCAAFVGTSLLTADALAAEKETPTERWAVDMRRFDKYDEEHPPQPGGIVFVGSSSIRLWDLHKSFPESKALNRGFGGSQIADSVRNLDRLVLRHKPAVVVMYAGDNDISGGKTPEVVLMDFEAFVAGIRKELPETKIAYIAIKPSIARWKLADTMQQANAAIKAFCERTEGCEFVDVWPAMLDEAGQPREELYVKDGLHLSAKGYAVWNELVRPHLK